MICKQTILGNLVQYILDLHAKISLGHMKSCILYFSLGVYCKLKITKDNVYIH
jgi:hypothetical protein